MERKESKYGMVYQSVTRDSSIPLVTKGLYAYLSSFCGSSDQCYPSIETILKETGISKDTFYKHINILVAAGIVEKKTEKFTNTVYRVKHKESFPDFPCPKNSYTKNLEKPFPKNQETKNNSIEKEHKGIIKDKCIDNTSKLCEGRFLPPSKEEVKKYCTEKGYRVDSERFVDFYSAKGWMIGKNKMKDWKAAVRTWVRNDREMRNGKHENSEDRSSATLY